jgi:hypothetical protein
MTQVVRPAWRIAVFLGLLVIVLALVEARLGQGEPRCGFSPLLGGRHNVFWCGDPDLLASKLSPPK